MSSRCCTALAPRASASSPGQDRRCACTSLTATTGMATWCGDSQNAPPTCGSSSAPSSHAANRALTDPRPYRPASLQNPPTLGGVALLMILPGCQGGAEGGNRILGISDSAGDRIVDKPPATRRDPARRCAVGVSGLLASHVARDPAIRGCDRGRQPFGIIILVRSGSG